MAAPPMNPTMAACDRKSTRNPSLKNKTPHINYHNYILIQKFKILEKKTWKSRRGPERRRWRRWRWKQSGGTTPHRKWGPPLSKSSQREAVRLQRLDQWRSLSNFPSLRILMAELRSCLQIFHNFYFLLNCEKYYKINQEIRCDFYHFAKLILKKSINKNAGVENILVAIKYVTRNYENVIDDLIRLT